MNDITPITDFESKFELLSAYLDGEVSTAERHQVEVWLSQDPKLRQTYQQLLVLQRQVKTIPVAAPSVQAEQIVSKVFAQADRSRRRRFLGGIGTAAALVVGAVSGLVVGQSWTLKTAQNPAEPQPIQSAQKTAVSVAQGDPTSLMLALDRPPVEIPVVQGSNLNKRQSVDTVNF